MNAEKYTTIDEYIKIYPRSTQVILKKIRALVKKAVPNAVESISYRMPAFKYNGKPLIYFAAFKNHIGVFPPVPFAFKKEVAKYAGPKGNLQFQYGEPIPYDLIKRIVIYKIRSSTKK